VILAFGSGKSGFTVKLARIKWNVQWYLCDLQLLSAEHAAVMRCWWGESNRVACPACLSLLFDDWCELSERLSYRISLLIAMDGLFAAFVRLSEG